MNEFPHMFPRQPGLGQDGGCICVVEVEQSDEDRSEESLIIMILNPKVPQLPQSEPRVIRPRRAIP